MGRSGSPWLGPRASGPPGLEASPSPSWAATPHPTAGVRTAPIIAAGPGEDKIDVID